MVLMDVPRSAKKLSAQLTLHEYLTLPEDTRAEIIDGVLRPMVRSNKRAREVQRRLANLIESRMPRQLRVSEEEVVVLKPDPPSSRIPDLSVFRGGTDPAGRTNHTPAADVLLVVEIVSPGSQTADRYEKPGEYARSGIPAFWRVELDPDIAVHVYNLFDGVYRDEGIHRRGGLLKDPTLPWLSIEVNDLLGRYA